MENNLLKVRMFGGFSLEFNDKEVVLDRNAVFKTMQLLQLILLHSQDGGISKAALIEALYGRAEVENKNGSLNNTIFRLRKQLQKAGLPESNYIQINAGMCSWDENVPVSVDVCQFRKLVQEGKEEKREENRIKIWKEAWNLYKGELLPDMIGENWAAAENASCRDLYFYCVEELCTRLQDKKRYEDIHKISHRAAEIYPFDNWQVWEIDSLISMSRYKEGLEVYRNTEKRLMDELGIAPSPQLVERFRFMGERASQAAGAIEDIKYRLMEKENVAGAYYCSYPSFVDVYHVFSRMVERTGLSVFIMLCTLNYENREVTEEEEQKMSAVLCESIQESIRKGDFYTKYNSRQYLVMLIEIEQESCQKVSKRINKQFMSKMGQKRSLKVNYYVASVGEVCQNTEKKSDIFE